MSPTAITARVLGHSLLLAPNDSRRDALVRDILACHEDPELLAGLAYLYIFGFILYNPKGPTPAVTPALTPRQSLEVAAQEPLLNPSFSNASNSRKLVSAFVTGDVDATWDLQCKGAHTPTSTPICTTKVAHIISQPLSESIHGITPA
ncbi:hypothetical protein L227DRAFT_277372 [Lentinus tigrinus ALCF2SS1-6]|uniref:Uncharacterized protein n=1 Tax=Lentinus tigrinus ALCF2SS1-6 TaxID=1328759 RepID=A0A5C2SN50_9APHY|nr:hypothetical protein L227DRAFT_277372 [Lentinus tigrinus ALCF2SS1-6]